MQLQHKIVMNWMLNLFLKLNKNVCRCWIATYYMPVINSRRHATKVYFSKETLNKKKKFRFCVCAGCFDRINNINVFDNCPNNWEREREYLDRRKKYSEGTKFSTLESIQKESIWFARNTREFSNSLIFQILRFWHRAD